MAVTIAVAVAVAVAVVEEVATVYLRVRWFRYFLDMAFLPCLPGVLVLARWSEETGRHPLPWYGMQATGSGKFNRAATDTDTNTIVKTRPGPGPAPRPRPRPRHRAKETSPVSPAA